ncbi:MAG: hypothetical protein ABJF23_13745 [Bryobacteraceae bacterium]
MSAGFKVETHAVSLLSVLLAVSTEVDGPDFRLESSFEGQTCLVAGNEAAITDTLRGLLEIAQRISGPSHKLTANLASAGGLVTLTLSEESGPAHWSLQFPELYPQEGANQMVAAEQTIKEPDTSNFEYVSFEEEDEMRASGQDGLLQPGSGHAEQTSS